MEVPRLRDFPNGFTATDVADRFDTSASSIYHRLSERVRLGLLLRKGPAIGIIENGYRRLMWVYEIPGNTTLCWKDVDQVMEKIPNKGGY